MTADVAVGYSSGLVADTGCCEPLELNMMLTLLIYGAGCCAFPLPPVFEPDVLMGSLVATLLKRVMPYFCRFSVCCYLSATSFKWAWLPPDVVFEEPCATACVCALKTYLSIVSWDRPGVSSESGR